MTAHKPGARTGRAPTVSLAILAHVAAHPGTTTKTLHAGIGGSRCSLLALLYRHINARRLFSSGSFVRRGFYVTQELAAAAEEQRLLAPQKPKRQAARHAQPDVRQALLDEPAGLTNAQLQILTGFAHKTIINALIRLKCRGEAVQLNRGTAYVYFSSQDELDAARAGYESAWDAIGAAKLVRQKARHRDAARVRHHTQAAARGVFSAPRKPAKVKPVKVKPVKVVRLKAEKVPKAAKAPAVPKPKKAAALVFVKTPITAAKPKVATRAGWGRDDPAHITANTIVTICPSPPHVLRTNTHFQF